MTHFATPEPHPWLPVTRPVPAKQPATPTPRTTRTIETARPPGAKNHRRPSPLIRTTIPIPEFRFKDLNPVSNPASHVYQHLGDGDLRTQLQRPNLLPNRNPPILRSRAQHQSLGARLGRFKTQNSRGCQGLERNELLILALPGHPFGLTYPPCATRGGWLANGCFAPGQIQFACSRKLSMTIA